jgi:hypothetical protein
MASKREQRGKDGLVALASQHFVGLSAAEAKLLEFAPKGETAVCGPNEDAKDPANDPAHAEQWPPEREIRASLIRWICVDRSAQNQVDPKGLLAFGAKVVGKLDLTHASPPFGLGLRHCRLMEDAVLASAHLAELDLQGTCVGSLMADNIHVDGSVWFNKGFRGGRVRLFGAQIAGDLECGNGIFQNPGEMALGAERITVKGSVFLKGSRVDGEVRLLAAQIGSDLNCVGAILNCGASGLALVADRIAVGGSVFLKKSRTAPPENVDVHPFRANGEVRLLGAEIGSNLDCGGGMFTTPAGIALNCDRMNVRGSVFFRNGFQADGLVVFNGAQIGSNLECDNSSFKCASKPVLGASGIALDGEGIHVRGSAFFRNGFSANGSVQLAHVVVARELQWRGVANPNETSLVLRNASVGALNDDVQSWPPPGGLALDGFTYQRISEEGKRLAWIARNQPFARQPYRQLAKVLREEGNDKGARQALFEMERLGRREHDDTWYRRLWTWTLKKTIGFGYYPGRSVLWLIGMIVVWAILFESGFAIGSIAPTDKDVYGPFKQSSKLAPHYESFNAWVYSFENSVPLVKLGQAERWQADPDPHWRCSPKARISPGLCRVLFPGALRVLRLVQICFGWFFTTMFVLAVTGIVRKE